MACAMARMLASRLACVRATPLGLPVLPEVYWMKAMSSPRSATGAALPGPCASCCGVSTWRRPGTRACSRRATTIASGTVTSTTARALSRMPVWRSTCSSSCEARAGG